MSILYPAMSRSAFIYWCLDSFPCCIHVSVTKHMSMLLSWIWCMNISNLGLRNCILTSAILSPVEFQKVLSDLLVATISNGEFQYYCSKLFSKF